MFHHLVVPVDGSAASFAAIPVAAKMAAAAGGRVDVITVTKRFADEALVREEMQRGIDRLGPLPLEPTLHVHVSHYVADAITRFVGSTLDGMLLMSAHGRGRSAAVLGSTSDEILRAVHGPVIMLGPHVSAVAGELGGTYVVPLDGSSRADGVLPIVAAWATEFGGTPQLVEVIDVVDVPSDDAVDWVESSVVSRGASELRQRIDRDVDFEVLHGHHPGSAIVDFAHEQQASLIFLATHGRTGFERMRSGSVAADVLRHAECPVVMFRPDDMSTARSLAWSDAAVGG